MSYFKKWFKLSNLDKIPQPIKDVLDQAAKTYSDSKHTSNAGFFLRLLCRFIKPSTIIKMFAHKIS